LIPHVKKQALLSLPGKHEKNFEDSTPDSIISKIWSQYHSSEGNKPSWLPDRGDHINGNDESRVLMMGETVVLSIIPVMVVSSDHFDVAFVKSGPIGTISERVWSWHFSRTFRMHTQILGEVENCDVPIGSTFSEPFSTPCCRGCDRRTIIPKSVKLTLILLSHDSFFQFPADSPALQHRGEFSDSNIDFFRLHRSFFSAR
jgi:hypothetical protein